MSSKSVKVVAVGITTLGLLASTAWAQRDLSDDTSSGGRMSKKQGQMSQSQQQRQQGAEQWEHPRASRLNLTSASDIVGLPVRDAQGQRIGSVRYIMLDARNGDVLYAILKPGGALDIGGNNLMAVPWSAVEFQKQALKVQKSASELEDAPQISRDRLADLTQPAVVGLLYNYYLVPEGQAQQGAQQGGQESQRQAQGQRRDRAEQPRLLIGRELITTLVGPAMRTAQQTRGKTVVSRDGEQIGSIEKVIIDPDHGHVAYLLVRREAGEDQPGQSIPVPFAALQWAPGERHYVLNADADRLQPVANLPRENFPTQVAPRQLQRLYAEYNVAPYWGRPALAAETPGSSDMAWPQGRQITATVQHIDEQHGTVTLRTSRGALIDLQVSEKLLSAMDEGEQIQVTLRRPPQRQQSGTSQPQSQSQQGQ